MEETKQPAFTGGPLCVSLLANSYNHSAPSGLLPGPRPRKEVRVWYQVSTDSKARALSTTQFLLCTSTSSGSPSATSYG